MGSAPFSDKSCVRLAALGPSQNRDLTPPSELRAGEKWRHVEREIDIRLRRVAR
jgi:hypothetical protein